LVRVPICVGFGLVFPVICTHMSFTERSEGASRRAAGGGGRAGTRGRAAGEERRRGGAVPAAARAGQPGPLHEGKGQGPAGARGASPGARRRAPALLRRAQPLPEGLQRLGHGNLPEPVSPRRRPEVTAPGRVRREQQSRDEDPCSPRRHSPSRRKVGAPLGRGASARGGGRSRPATAPRSNAESKRHAEPLGRACRRSASARRSRRSTGTAGRRGRRGARSARECQPQAAVARSPGHGAECSSGRAPGDAVHQAVYNPLHGHCAAMKTPAEPGPTSCGVDASDAPVIAAARQMRAGPCCGWAQRGGKAEDGWRSRGGRAPAPGSGAAGLAECRRELIGLERPLPDSADRARADDRGARLEARERSSLRPEGALVASSARSRPGGSGAGPGGVRRHAGGASPPERTPETPGLRRKRRSLRPPGAGLRVRATSFVAGRLVVRPRLPGPGRRVPGCSRT